VNPALRLLTIGLAFLLCACSLADTILPDPEPSLSALDDTASQIWKLYPGLKLAGNPEVSAVHRNPSSSLAEWAMCLRNDAADRRQYYTLFFRNRRIADFRLSVISDGCENESYVPLPELKGVEAKQ